MHSNLALGKTLVNSHRQIYKVSVSVLNAIMDIDDIRRSNIHRLETEAGSAKDAASRVDMTYVQYVNLRDGAKDPRSGKRRGMRKETAARFEQAFYKPPGWLDINHDTLSVQAEVTPFVVRPTHPRVLVQRLCDIAEKASDNGLCELIDFAGYIAAKYPIDQAKPASSQ